MDQVYCSREMMPRISDASFGSASMAVRMITSMSAGSSASGRHMSVMMLSPSTLMLMCRATITSGTTRDNKDYQRDYLLTLEMVHVRTGKYQKESAELSKGYNRSMLAKVKNLNPF